MNKFKKAISVGMSAALLASLFTVIAAPAALAATTVGSAGSVPRGGTSTGTVTFTFTEATAACLAATQPLASDLTVTINTVGVTFSGTPTVSAPGSLGATASASGAVLTVNITGSDILNPETIVVGGLNLVATTTATVGDVTATVAGPDATTLGCFTTGSTTATGLVGIGIGTGAPSVVVNVDNCLFEVTDTTDLAPGALVFGTGGTAETRNITAIAAGPGAGQQTLTIQSTTVAHPADQVVSQNPVLGCTSTALTGLGTVRDSLIYNASATPLLFPGENNQAAPSLTATERTAGFITVNTVVTFTITTPGVVFSGLPTLAATNGLTFGAVALSADRTTATATSSTLSATPSTITLSNINYDVAATVPSGTMVSVTLALSGSKTVVPTSRSNAQIGRIFTATAASLPNVNIGSNNQATGLITIVEVTAGSFTDGSGSNNVFEICPDATSSFSSPGPWAKVTTTGAGALILREGAVASTDNIVAGAADAANPGCYYWTVWTKSTVVSTIQIGNADFTSGPLVSVNAGSATGPLNARLYAGSLAALVLQVTLPIATRVFPGQVSVTAVSQPIMAPGATHALAGNILLQESANGQLKLGSEICVEIVPNQQTGDLTDAYLTSLNTADRPIATAENGVTVGPVLFSTEGCNGIDHTPGSLPESFSVVISQQSTTGNGKVTISNIHYSVLNDAALGPVQVNVWGLGVGGTLVDFQRIISNARIGTPLAGTSATRLGVTQVGSFTVSTKVQRTGRYVTYRFDFGVAAAGAHIAIWGATKTGNDWSAFTKVTGRVANASGVVYYYIRQNATTWKSYRAQWTNGGAFTPARQARWR